MELREGLFEAVVGDLIVFDVQPVEDRLVEQTPLFVVASAIQLLGVFQQFQASLDEAGAVGKIFGGLVEAFGQVSALVSDVSKSALDLGLGECVVGGQVDQVVLSYVQRAKLTGELLPEQPGGRLLVGNGVEDVGADVGNEVWAEPDSGIVLIDGVLDVDHVDVRGLAGAVLGVAAEEVGVRGAVAIDGVLNGHPLGDARRPFAATAEQRPFEVVMVDTAAFSSDGAGLDDVLNLLKEVFVDECVVAALDLLAVVRHIAEVVAVAQHV